MIIKHLFNHHNEPVGKAYVHKRNATVDIKYNADKIHYANVKLDFEEFDGYLDRMDLSTGENEQMELL